MSEKNFPKDFAKLYHDRIEENITIGDTLQLSIEKAKSNCDISNNIYHHGVLNGSKPGKVHVVFNGSAKFHSMLLNDSLLSGVDFLNNLISILLDLNQLLRRRSIKSYCIWKILMESKFTRWIKRLCNISTDIRLSRFTLLRKLDIAKN